MPIAVLAGVVLLAVYNFADIGIRHAGGRRPASLRGRRMFGASASFATPIGYQTNTLVYGAGDHRFSDFLKIGIPMNIAAGVASVLAIRVFFPTE